MSAVVDEVDFTSLKNELRDAERECARLNRILDFVETHDPELHTRACVHERISRTEHTD